MSSNLTNLPMITIGQLISSVTGLETDYQIYEISKLLLGIIATDSLEPGMTLRLITKEKKCHELIIHSSECFAGKGNLAKHKLATLDANTDFEKLCTSGDVTQANVDKTELAHSKLGTIRFVRFITDPPILIHAKTFGQGRPYKLTSVNISKSGILTMANITPKIPFNLNTLVEITMMPNSYVTQEINCVGKIVRHTGVEREASLQYLGMVLVEFQRNGIDIWHNALDILEQQLVFGIFATQIPGRSDSSA